MLLYAGVFTAGILMAIPR
jgi:hypothetical protein